MVSTICLDAGFSWEMNLRKSKIWRPCWRWESVDLLNSISEIVRWQDINNIEASNNHLATAVIYTKPADHWDTQE